MAPRQGPPPRSVRRTALIVGEGLAEEVFLSHLKHLVAQRGQQSIAVKSAKGKGGRHVLDVALRQWRVADYDRVAVLLDTDTDWDDAQRARARKAKVEVFESSPCLEAMLLSILKRPVPAATKDCKRDFEAAVGGPAHQPRVYAEHFALDAVEAASVPMLARLLTWLRGEARLPLG